MRDAPIVETDQGRVVGASAAPECWAYLGIPYAAPPVGPGRWRPPAPAAAWTGIRDATAFGPDPIQPPGLRRSRAPAMDEDCLYLNVWTPKERRTGGWPVLVWSCGGAFTFGSGAFAEEDPARLAARGAVVVSFNVRLGVFGFLAHPALSAEAAHGTSGNYGLMDQGAAFGWVRRNVAGFGGDPDRITFFGESAGATMGALLLASPQVARPYERAILMSPGSFSALLPREEAERHGAGLGATAAEIRAIPAEALAERARGLAPVSPSLWLARPLRPIADGWFLPAGTRFAAGRFAAVPAIIGTNEDEGHFFGPRMAIRTVAEYEAFVAAIFGRNAGAALACYPVANDAEVPAMFAALYGDRGFTYPVDALARAFAAEAPVFRYVYAYRHGRSDRPPTHSEQTGVLLDTLPHERPEDATMADLMARYWLAFAAGGDPNAPGLPYWPRYATGAEDHLRLDAPPSRGSAWRAEAVRFIATHATDQGGEA
ncbi:carboxylesterase/lipase family protein [Sphingomonas profundi]|uniref:carboxylesterase/lipase family protein n=1 Tax=Alterirhizorhabdus profundi TaxID=2681549 RepID=UPI0012E7EE3C|nr:carboxylesterase family protein [Sphingomonas profundi]